jgi:plastocyanin
MGLAMGCAGPVTPSPTGPVVPSPGRSTPSIETSSGRPASTVSLPPATPSTSWTVTAGGDTEVYHYRPGSLIVPANQAVNVRFVDGDTLDHTWTVFDTDGATVLANLSVAKQGDVATGTFTFPNPGSYSFWCTIPGHKEFGEVGTLTVVP